MDLETEPASESSILQPLHWEPSLLNIVSGTPHEDSPHSIPSPDLTLQSHPKVPQAEPFCQSGAQATLAHVSTPSAVGAIRKSNMLSFVTPAPVRARGSLLVP